VDVEVLLEVVLERTPRPARASAKLAAAVGRLLEAFGSIEAVRVDDLRSRGVGRNGPV